MRWRSFQECIERGRKILNLCPKAARLHMMKAVFMSMAAISAFVWRERLHTVSKDQFLSQKSILRFFSLIILKVLTAFCLHIVSCLFTYLSAVCLHIISCLFTYLSAICLHIMSCLFTHCQLFVYFLSAVCLHISAVCLHYIGCTHFACCHFFCLHDVSCLLSFSVCLH